MDIRSGVFTAMATPFDQQGKIDLDAWHKMLSQQEFGGVDGIVIGGTTGESPTLREAELKMLIQTAKNAFENIDAAQRPKIWVGTGTNSTALTIEKSKWVSELGVDALLIVTPYYNKPSQEGLVEHFAQIADSVNCPIVLYNVPGRTSVNLSVLSCVKLSEHPRIAGIKDSTGDLARITELKLKCSDSFRVFCGDDICFLPALALGCDGVVSVISNLVPQDWVSMHKAFLFGELNRAKLIHHKYFLLNQNLFVESNPVPLKYALSKIELCQPYVRSPLRELSEASKRLIENDLKSVTLL